MNQSRYVFPILVFNRDRRKYPDCPLTLPWGRIEGYRRPIEESYNAKLEAIATRRCSVTITVNGVESVAQVGGLDPIELLCIFERRPFGLRGRYDEEYGRAVKLLKQLQ